MRDIFILSACRTPIGTAFKEASATPRPPHCRFQSSPKLFAGQARQPAMSATWSLPNPCTAVGYWRAIPLSRQACARLPEWPSIVIAPVGSPQ